MFKIDNIVFFNIHFITNSICLLNHIIGEKRMRLLKYLMVIIYMSGLPLLAAAPPKIADLFTDIKSTHIPSHVTLPPQALNGKFVSVDAKALKTDEIRISLPGKQVIHAINKKTKTHSNGSQIWRGEVVGKKNSSAIFSQHGNAVAGVIRIDEKVYKLLPVEDGINSIIEVSPNEPWPETEPRLSPGSSISTQQLSSDTPQIAGDQLPPSDDGSVIDIMVVYSSATRATYGGVDGINAYIATGIAESNQAYDNSEIYTQLNLVHTVEVIDVTNSIGDNLDYMTRSAGHEDDPNGYYDEIHTIRDQQGADMVSYFVDDPVNSIGDPTCGLAWVAFEPIAAYAAYGFSVIGTDCAVGYYSLAHELGHNMGSQHNIEDASFQGVYPYSYGFRDLATSFRSIMSYNCPEGSCYTRYPYFSNPDILVNGVVIGEENTKDNARSINETKVAVSQWRTSLSGLEEYVEDAVIMFPSDDVDEYYEDSGRMHMGLSYHYLGLLSTGLRFRDVNIPYGATITSSYLIFTAGEYYDDSITNVTIRAEAIDDSPIFTSTAYDVTNRSLTTTNTTWSIPQTSETWVEDYQNNSPSINSVIQEVIDRDGWADGNSMTLIISPNSGRRYSKTWDTGSPVRLHTEYTFDCIQNIALPENQWSMISMACDPGNKTVTDLFPDQLSGEYDTTWALYERNATNETYRLLALNEVPVEGRGYWFFTEQAGITLSMKGKDNSGSNIPLISNASGRLNLVGNPYDSTVAWADVEVVDSGETPRSLTYADDNNLMSRTMYQWNGSAYQTYDGITPSAEGTLKIFDSFWVKAYQSGISLRIPSGAAAGDVASDTQIRTLSLDVDNTPIVSDEEQNDPSKNDWFVRLVVESGLLKDPGNALGQLHDSVDGQDIHDLEEKAPFGSPYLSIVFPHDDFEGGEWGFTTDFHSLKKEKDHWTFVVKASDNVTDGVLSWEGPKEILRKAIIIDKETGKRIRLKKVENYRFKIKNGEHKFIFKIKKRKK